jgi:hypothetical protein
MEALTEVVTLPRPPIIEVSSAVLSLIFFSLIIAPFFRHHLLSAHSPSIIGFLFLHSIPSHYPTWISIPCPVLVLFGKPVLVVAVWAERIPEKKRK